MATLALIIVTAIWGWTFVPVKEAVAEVGPFWFLALRFSLAFLCTIPFLRRGPLPWREALLLGAFLFGGYFFQTWGLRYTTAQKSGLITGLSVVLVPIVARFLGERVSRRAALGVVLAGLGVAFLSLGAETGGEGSLFGDLLTVICAVSFALYIAFLARYARSTGIGPLLPLQLAVVAVLSFLGAGLFGEVRWPLSSQAWKALVITGILASALAYYVLAWAESRASATKTAVILAMEPVFAAFFGWLLLGETLSSLQLGGALLVLSGIFVVSAVDPGKKGPDNR
ncbi:MAG: DMT family transporter [Candidatus Bipolaricaulaceae bacterium]